MVKADIERGYGLVAALATYAIWGFFPLYFVLLLSEVNPWEILAHRVLWGVAVLVGIISMTRQWGSIADVIRNSRARNGLAVAALLMGVVWFFYGYGALTGHAVDVALGYFISPLITMTLAVAVEGEKLRTTQWASAAIGVFAILVVIIGYGRIPWISFVIAVAFALYSLVKSHIGRGVKATVGLTVESLFLLPFIGGIMIWLYASKHAVFAVKGLASTELWLVLSGPLTALPLLLFAVAAARLPLSVIGNLQYLNPALQFVAGVLILREEMPTMRLLGFGLVWLALVVLVFDASRVRTRVGGALMQ